jgi:hypothetical protein
MIRNISTDSNSHEIFSPTYRLCPDQPNVAIQANKDIGTFLNFTLSYLGIVSELQVKYRKIPLTSVPSRTNSIHPVCPLVNSQIGLIVVTVSNYAKDTSISPSLSSLNPSTGTL